MFFKVRAWEVRGGWKWKRGWGDKWWWGRKGRKEKRKGGRKKNVCFSKPHKLLVCVWEGC